MAIFHLSYQSRSRADGIAAAKRYTSLLRPKKSASEADEALYIEHAHYPSYVTDPLDFWKAADAYERVNGRLFLEIGVALPRELEPAQRLELARDWALWLSFKRPVQVEDSPVPEAPPYPMPYTLVVDHDPQGGNPHARIMLSERPTDGVTRSLEATFKRAHSASPELGGAAKSLAFRHPKMLLELRQVWALKTNEALERAGHEARIDYRSLAEQGITREPTVHLGARVMEMERKGIQTDRGDELRSILLRNQQQQANAEEGADAQTP